MVTFHSEHKYRYLYQFCYVKIFSTNQDENLVLLDAPGRVRSQIASVGSDTKSNNMNTPTFTFNTFIYIMYTVH